MLDQNEKSFLGPYQSCTSELKKEKHRKMFGSKMLLLLLTVVVVVAVEI